MKVEYNFTIIPNWQLEELPYFLTSTELRVLLFMQRRIFGFHRKSEYISIQEISKGKRSKDGELVQQGTGIGRVSAISKAIKNLTDFGVIIKKKDAVRYPPSKRKAAKYSLQTDDEKVLWGELISRKDAKSDVRKEHIDLINRLKQLKKDVDIAFQDIEIQD